MGPGVRRDDSVFDAVVKNFVNAMFTTFMRVRFTNVFE
jgi:hypothetical protein